MERQLLEVTTLRPQIKIGGYIINICRTSLYGVELRKLSEIA